MTTQFDDEIIVSGREPYDPERTLPEGEFVFTVERLTMITREKYMKPGETEQALDVLCRTTDHADNNGWNGYTCDFRMAIPGNMADDRGTAHKLWKACRGETPVVGGNYPLRSGLIGQTFRARVKHNISKQGGTFAHLDPNTFTPAAKTAPPPPPRRAPAPVAAADDDDLRDA